MNWSMERHPANHFNDADCLRFDRDEMRLSECLEVVAWLERSCGHLEWPSVLWGVLAQMDGEEVWGVRDRETRVDMWVEFSDCPDIAVLFALAFGGV